MSTRKYEDLFPEEWYELNPEIDESMDKLITEPRKKRVYVPRGYVEGENKFCHPIPGILQGLVQFMVDFRVTNTRSLREIQDLIASLERENGIEDPGIISLGGITQLFDRLERDLGIRIKENARERVQRKRIERTKKAREEGKKRPYAHSSKVKAKLEVQKRLTHTNRELKELEKDRKRLQRKAARNARQLKLKDDPTKYVESNPDTGEISYETKKPTIKAPEIIIPDTNLIESYTDALRKGIDERILSEMYQEIKDKGPDYEKRKVAFLPTPRQYMFMSAPEDVVLYGGAAGGGKSYAMVIDALRYVEYSNYKGVIIRKTSPELAELIDNSRELYPLAVKGAKFNSSENLWRFPNGAQIKFSFLDRSDDKYKYQGQQYQYVGFDEIAQHATDEGFRYLITRLRDPKERMYPYLRATANPGSMWVYETFIKDREPNVPFILPGTENHEKPYTARFIPAKLEDNPYLSNNGIYKSNLLASGGVLAKQLLEGDWLAAEDNMFPDFNILEHVVEPFIIPRHWNRVAGLDYGYRDPSAAVWFAVNPEDGSLVIYDEFLQSGLTGREFSLEILKREENELVPVTHPIDWSVFARTGHTGPTIAESMLSVPGFRLQRADKNREAGWVQIHQHLRKDPATGAPKIQIFTTCRGLIRQLLSAKIHKTKPNDLDDTRNSDGHWDLLDALRYGIMSRPRMETYQQNLLRTKQNNRWNQVNGYFST